MGYTTTPVVIWRDTSPTRVTCIYSQWSCEFVNLMHIGPNQIYNYDHDFVLLELHKAKLFYETMFFDIIFTYLW